MDPNRGQQGQVNRVDLPSGTEIVTAVAKKAFASPKVRVALVLWAVGLFVMTLAPAFIKVTPEMEMKYDSMVRTADNMFEYGEAFDDLSRAKADLYDAKVWFWRFRDPHRAIVAAKQEIVDVKQKRVDELSVQRDQKMSEAKAYVGLWSEYGLSEARERFWSAFESGKVFAKRQTFWQMFYSLLSSREESLIGVLLHWVMVTLINFTLGLLGSLFYFTFSLGQMVLTYNSDPFSTTAFYVLFLLGGASLVATYLFILYGFAAGSVYVAGRVALRQGALQYERQQRGQRIRHSHEHQM